MTDRIVFVYKSAQKARHWLYMAEKDAFAKLPEGLLTAFGTPKFVMMFALSKHRQLPKISREQLENALNEKGYLLRIDLEDEEESLINQERRYRGHEPLDKDQLRELFK
ncbi:MAG: YcgL domain-containing protein [Succinivibrio sp.]|nr:YcgL domain-containing protein [Succinivibrio sp.]